jgi:hypothetical protein
VTLCESKELDVGLSAPTLTAGVGTLGSHLGLSLNAEHRDQIDVGGGTSTLVDELWARGFTDLSVLDVSEVAPSSARRLREGAQVEWLHADVLNWQPERRYGL